VSLLGSQSGKRRKGKGSTNRERGFEGGPGARENGFFPVGIPNQMKRKKRVLQNASKDQILKGKIRGKETKVPPLLSKKKKRSAGR